MLVTRDILDIRNYLNVERVRDFIDVEVSGAFDEPPNEKQSQPPAAAAAQQAEKASAVSGVVSAAPFPKPPSASVDAHAAIPCGLPTRPRTPHTPTTERKLSTAGATSAPGAGAQALPAPAHDSGAKTQVKSAGDEQHKSTAPAPAPAAESTSAIIENARNRFIEHIEGKPGRQPLSACQVDMTVRSS